MAILRDLFFQTSPAAIVVVSLIKATLILSIAQLAIAVAADRGVPDAYVPGVGDAPRGGPASRRGQDRPP